MYCQSQDYLSKFQENGYTRFEFLEGMSLKVGHIILNTWCSLGCGCACVGVGVCACVSVWLCLFIYLCSFVYILACSGIGLERDWH